MGEGGARFYCLAFVPVRYFEKKKPKIPATLAIYYCAHKDFTRFSLSSQGSDGQPLSYSRGNDNHDSLEFLLLQTALEMGLEPAVHPSMWLLFPKDRISSGFRSPGYWASRRELCRLLFIFRGHETVRRMTADMPKSPLMVLERSVRRLAMEDSKVDDEEIQDAMLKGMAQVN